jgi:Yip1 domain
MDIVQRAKNILLQPKQEWQVIAGESTTVKDIYLQYVVILAAIPAVAAFIGLAFVGVGAFGVSYRVPVVSALAHMITSYVLALAMVYVLALIIDALAPNFGGQKNFLQAFKVAAFALTASWLAGIFTIIPMLGILALLGSLYSLYLLFVGLPVLMKTPEDKAMGYTVVIIIVAIVISVVISAFSRFMIPGRMGGF